MFSLVSALALSIALPAGAAAAPSVESVHFTDGFGVVRVAAGRHRTHDLVSRDGGRTFRRLPEPGGDTNALVLLPSGLGYRTDRRGRLWRTTDGGHRWQGTPLPRGITDIEAADTGVWALRARDDVDGPVRLFRSADGGKTWTSQPTPIGNGPDGPDGHLAFADAADGVLTGLTAHFHLVLRVTRDGGRTWTRRRAPCSPGWTPEKGAPIVRWLPSGAMWVLCFGDPMASTRPLELHQSFDGGRTFTLRSRTAESTLLTSTPRPEIGSGLGGRGGAVVRFEPRDGVSALLATARSVTRTTDGGRTWTTQRPLPVRFEQLFDVSTDGPTLWLARGFGDRRHHAGLLRSDDEGAHWQRIALPPS